MISLLCIPSILAVFYLLLWVVEPEKQDSLITVWGWFDER